MLALKNIHKSYKTGNETFIALDDVSLNFNETSFVSILGASGSGKTTLLNIIGGLDKYTSGDLIVDGTSTKNFKDKDWDSYRNSTIGFVFQSYNLISHLSILDNVKMALSLSGNSAKECDARARQALAEVGLEKHVLKRPNQLSGGQMQRVAIARALVTDPKILLADEPTGALDSKTSTQIMELIKEISKSRLVIMVTHNPELAQSYSDRIIRVSDGKIIEDTAPIADDTKTSAGYRNIKTSMSFGDAIKSSAKNLLTKKTRTALVTLAGSIGIVSIGLVLSLSAGMTQYIDVMQEDTLAGTPLTISSTETSFSQTMPVATSESKEDNTTITPLKMVQTHDNVYNEDVLDNGYTFIEYMEKNASKYYSSIAYQSGYSLKALTENSDGEIQEVKEETDAATAMMSQSMFSTSTLFDQLPASEEPVLNQYEVVSTLDDSFKYPENANEVVLVINSDNSLSPETLQALGYDKDEDIDYKDIVGQTMRIVTNDDYYYQLPDGIHYATNTINQEMYDKGIEVTITAILRPLESSSSLISGTIGYTQALTDQVIAIEKDSELVKTQADNSDINVLSPSTQKIDDETYLSLMQTIGGDTTPTRISIFPTTFEDRESVIAVIEDYNKLVADKFGATSDDYKKYFIAYTDLAQIMTGAMTTMIDTITIILTAFAAISLLVSSIMIGILTYVSVVERTKEIGIMRAIGARKKDITRIFKAEASIIGLLSGLFGVGLAWLLCIPINSVVANALGMDDFVANLSVTNAVSLVVLSVLLTFIAGLIPSKGAAKKDPVESLRTE